MQITTIGRYAIRPEGDTNRSMCIGMLYNFGYKASIPEDHISRVGFNTIMFLENGTWTNWTDEAALSNNLTIIEGKEFIKNPVKYLPEDYV